RRSSKADAVSWRRTRLEAPFQRVVLRHAGSVEVRFDARAAHVLELHQERDGERRVRPAERARPEQRPLALGLDLRLAPIKPTAELHRGETVGRGVLVTV